MRLTSCLLIVAAVGRLTAQAQPEPAPHSPGAMLVHVAGTGGALLNGAEVELPTLDVKFAVPEGGTLLINHVPAATYVVRVRRLGYAIQTRLVSVHADTTSVNFLLERIATPLDTVNVNAAGPLELANFERRLEAYSGKFFTAGDIAKSNSILLTEFLGRIGGLQCPQHPSVYLDGVPINALEGSDPAAYLRPMNARASLPVTATGTAGTSTGTNPSTSPTPPTTGKAPATPRPAAGAVAAANAAATPNPLQSSAALPAFDINAISLSQIAAMEVYPSAAPASLQAYRNGSSHCATVLLWSKPKGD